jgi:hypothetical protein
MDFLQGNTTATDRGRKLHAMRCDANEIKRRKKLG